MNGRRAWKAKGQEEKRREEKRREGKEMYE
jgi:hypothetical protein